MSQLCRALACLLVVVLFPVFAPELAAQSEPPAREQAILLTPNNVLSVRTDLIRARAQYLQASGDFLVSAAIARRHHALAAQQEIRNHAEWVRTYFELRDLNKAYRLKENPPFIDRAEKRQKQLERAIIDNPQLTLEGGVTDVKLNWLLDKIATTALAAQALADAEPGRRLGAVDGALTAAELRHIVLTDGGHAGGRKLVFRAHEARALETPWPFALRGPEFEPQCRQFELARDRALAEVAERGEIAYETQLALRHAVDELMIALQREYPRHRRHASSDEWWNYSLANRFLQSLALSVKRALDTNDRQVFDGSYRFRGDTVVELIQHLCRHGLEFARPEPGDEGVYTKLFRAMREIYLDARAANELASRD